MSVRILEGDCRELLRTLPDESVHCVVTSPPYWGLRDYGVTGQLGMERSLGEHVETMTAVFREVRRVLRSDGTLWLNYGDSYAAAPNGRAAKDIVDDDRTFRDKPFSTIGPINGHDKPGAKFAGPSRRGAQRFSEAGLDTSILKPKDLCGIPWRVAFALQADGWWLRQDIIWSKPNPMPESVRDRCTKAHEYIFLLSKAERYYYDAEAIAEESIRAGDIPGATGGFDGDGINDARYRDGLKINGARPVPATRNKRSVWEVATAPFSEAHFATFPPALIEPCILAGCAERCCSQCGAPWERLIEVESRPNKPPSDAAKYNGNGMHRGMSVGREDRRDRQDRGFTPSCSYNATTVPGTVLDPFGGAGTTGLVADRLQRNAILIELNPAYAEMADRRLRDDAGMFAEIHP